MSEKTTPRKPCVSLNNPLGYIICQKEEKNQRKRKSLGGKTSDALLNKLAKILDVPRELLIDNSHRYICESPCLRDLDNHFKYREKSDELKSDLQKRFSCNIERRTKRGLPSDVAPENAIKTRTAKSLTFSTTANPHNEPELSLEQASNLSKRPLIAPARIPQQQHEHETRCHEGAVDTISGNSGQDLLQECQDIQVIYFDINCLKFISFCDKCTST